MRIIALLWSAVTNKSHGTTTSSHRVGHRSFAPLPTALADIKLAHSVFALPFAVLAAFLVTPAAAVEPSPNAWPRFGGQLALVVACMVLARTWAMLFNRLADRRFDAHNPRTAKRALPAGRLRTRDASLIAAAAAALFIACCALFYALYANPWPITLSVPTLAWIAFYSLTKRFTALSHLFLGGALAASPIAAAIAVRPESLTDTPALWLIAGMVLLWVAGFDVIYALQDIDFDRQTNLRSLPARIGWKPAVWISRVFHAGAVALLISAWRLDDSLDALFLAGVALAGALILAEHVVLARRGLAGLPMAFFTCNGVVSLILGALGSLDAVIH